MERMRPARALPPNHPEIGGQNRECTYGIGENHTPDCALKAVALEQLSGRLGAVKVADVVAPGPVNSVTVDFKNARPNGLRLEPVGFATP